MFRDGWCLMDAFRLNLFIRSWQVHSNNRWHKFQGSIIKLFGSMDHNLAWLDFSENDVFDCSAYVIPWDFVMVSMIVEPAQWLIVSANSRKINLDRNWAPYHHTTKRHRWMIYRIPSPRYQSPFSDNSLMLFYYGLSFRSPQRNFYSLSRLLHL